MDFPSTSRWCGPSQKSLFRNRISNAIPLNERTGGGPSNGVLSKIHTFLILSYFFFCQSASFCYHIGLDAVIVVSTLVSSGFVALEKSVLNHFILRRAFLLTFFFLHTSASSYYLYCTEELDVNMHLGAREMAETIFTYICLTEIPREH